MSTSDTIFWMLFAVWAFLGGMLYERGKHMKYWREGFDAAKKIYKEKLF